MLGIIPAAGIAQRMQPLGCSKELLPVGTRLVNGVARPRAVAEYLIERMTAAGATRICCVISPNKSDLLRYFAAHECATRLFYAVQPEARGLCDALFRAAPFTRPGEPILIGLPDTVWFPADAYRPALDFTAGGVNLVCFPVADPAQFDAVIADEEGRVERVEVKQAGARSRWVWGAVTCTAEAFHDLRLLWESRQCGDEFLGSLLNAYLARGGAVRALRVGEAYLDVGTVTGYHAAQDFLRRRERALDDEAAA